MKFAKIVYVLYVKNLHVRLCLITHESGMGLSQTSVPDSNPSSLSDLHSLQD